MHQQRGPLYAAMGSQPSKSCGDQLLRAIARGDVDIISSLMLSRHDALASALRVLPDRGPHSCLLQHAIVRAPPESVLAVCRCLLRNTERAVLPVAASVYTTPASRHRLMVGTMLQDITRKACQFQRDPRQMLTAEQGRQLVQLLREAYEALRQGLPEPVDWEDVLFGNDQVHFWKLLATSPLPPGQWSDFVAMLAAKDVVLKPSMDQLAGLPFSEAAAVPMHEQLRRHAVLLQLAGMAAAKASDGDELLCRYLRAAPGYKITLPRRTTAPLLTAPICRPVSLRSRAFLPMVQRGTASIFNHWMNECRIGLQEWVVSSGPPEYAQRPIVTFFAMCYRVVMCAANVLAELPPRAVEPGVALHLLAAMLCRLMGTPCSHGVQCGVRGQTGAPWVCSACPAHKDLVWSLCCEQHMHRRDLAIEHDASTVVSGRGQGMRHQPPANPFAARLPPGLMPQARPGLVDLVPSPPGNGTVQQPIHFMRDDTSRASPRSRVSMRPRRARSVSPARSRMLDEDRNPGAAAAAPALLDDASSGSLRVRNIVAARNTAPHFAAGPELPTLPPPPASLLDVAAAPARRSRSGSSASTSSSLTIPLATAVPNAMPHPNPEQRGGTAINPLFDSRDALLPEFRERAALPAQGRETRAVMPRLPMPQSPSAARLAGAPQRVPGLHSFMSDSRSSSGSSGSSSSSVTSGGSVISSTIDAHTSRRQVLLAELIETAHTRNATRPPPMEDHLSGLIASIQAVEAAAAAPPRDDAELNILGHPEFAVRDERRMIRRETSRWPFDHERTEVSISADVLRQHSCLGNLLLGWQAYTPTLAVQCTIDALLMFATAARAEPDRPCTTALLLRTLVPGLRTGSAGPFQDMPALAAMFAGALTPSIRWNRRSALLAWRKARATESTPHARRGWPQRDADMYLL